MKILAIDPGERNYGYSVVKIEVAKGKLLLRVIDSGYVENTIINLTHNGNKKIGKHIHDSVEVELPRFGKAIDGLLNKHKPERVGVERYQARMKGKTVETVSMMNGMLLDRVTKKKIRWYLYVAATWKNWVARVGGDKQFLESLYKVGEVRSLQHHTVDTVLMAVYMFFQEYPETPLTKNILRNAVRNTKLREV